MADSEQREKLVALREMLRERFPGSVPAAGTETFATGLPELDSQLGGGLPLGGITEVVADGPSCGVQWFFSTLVNVSAVNRRLVALVDRWDAWDPRSAASTALEYLLWVRCREAGQAVRAADILVRDGNIPLILMDMRPTAGSAADRIPSQGWYRLQRCAEQSRAVLAVASGHCGGSVPGCRLRLRLDRHFRLEHLEFSHEELAEAWKADVRYRGGAGREGRAV